MGNMPGVVIGVEKPGWMHARAMQIRTEPGPMHQSRSNSRHQWPDLRDAQGRNPRDPGKRQRELCQCCPSRVSALIDTLKKNQSKGALPEDEQQEMKSLPVKEEKDNNKELNQALKGLRKARKRRAGLLRSQVYPSCTVAQVPLAECDTMAKISRINSRPRKRLR